MRERRESLSWMMLVILLLAFTAMGTINVGTVSGETLPVIYVDPPTITDQVGATFTVNITISDVSNLYFWEFHMSFDKTVLNVTSATEGPFLSDVDSTSWNLMPPYINNTAGTVKASNLLWYYPPEGASGNGTLCTITFQVKDMGKTTLHFYYTILATFDGDSLLPIEHTAEDGFFSNLIPGDIGGDTPGTPPDGDVDRYDFGFFAAAYGSSIGDPNFNPLADLTGDTTGSPPDGDVDRYDFGVFAGNYGRTI
jgi:hypothetical protein